MQKSLRYFAFLFILFIGLLVGAESFAINLRDGCGDGVGESASLRIEPSTAIVLAAIFNMPEETLAAWGTSQVYVLSRYLEKSAGIKLADATRLVETEAIRRSGLAGESLEGMQA